MKQILKKIKNTTSPTKKLQQEKTKIAKMEDMGAPLIQQGDGPAVPAGDTHILNLRSNWL